MAIFIKEDRVIKYGIAIRNMNRTTLAPTMIQIQEETVEEIYVSDEEINDEIIEERKEGIHSLMEDTKDET